MDWCRRCLASDAHVGLLLDSSSWDESPVPSEQYFTSVPDLRPPLGWFLSIRNIGIMQSKLPPSRMVEILWYWFWFSSFGLYDSDASQYVYRCAESEWCLITDNRPDPNGILAFLVEALQATEDAGQRAWIIGHVPPGHVDTMHDQVSYDRKSNFLVIDLTTLQSNYYDQIIQRYKNSIAGQLFGHTHAVSILSPTRSSLHYLHHHRTSLKSHIRIIVIRMRLLLYHGRQSDQPLLQRVCHLQFVPGDSG